MRNVLNGKDFPSSRPGPGGADAGADGRAASWLGEPGRRGLRAHPCMELHDSGAGRHRCARRPPVAHLLRPAYRTRAAARMEKDPILPSVIQSPVRTGDPGRRPLHGPQQGTRHPAAQVSALPPIRAHPRRWSPSLAQRGTRLPRRSFAVRGQYRAQCRGYSRPGRCLAWWPTVEHIELQEISSIAFTWLWNALSWLAESSAMEVLHMARARRTPAFWGIAC
jgi:hypothetical protein